ncbi:MAG TPA: primosomal protein N' [Firmicutes bacterium]|nr:primosomal protein N' [Bacillota bacterium]
MLIAEVVVDIKNKAVDRVFDYAIPSELAHVIQAGSRVLVPFGPRTISGFVIQIKNESEHAKLRPIKEVLDIVPILNDELRSLGMLLSKETGSTMIQCFEAMIPNAMRSKYKKKLLKLTQAVLPELESLFLNTELIDFDVVPKTLLSSVKKAVELKQLEVIYEAKDALGKKMVKYLALTEEFNSLIQNINLNRAPKQLVLVDYLKEATHPVDKQTVFQTLQLNQSHVKPLIDKGLVQEFEVEAYRDPFKNVEVKKSTAFVLNEEQAQAVDAVVNAYSQQLNQTFLLHGVTGSGKTEVYLQIIDSVIAQEKQAIMLVPEIALTPQIASRFKNRFGNAVAVLHSGLSMGEKYDEWRKILKGEVSIVVGARSAIFAPFKQLGVIIVDEEHESTYKQEEAPRYHAIEVAKLRASYHKCPLVLGSATPSLETFARAKKGVYHLLTLSQRAVKSAILPTVKLIDMKAVSADESHLIISHELGMAIDDRMQNNEQVVLLLNRRGYSNFLQCRECGDVVTCPNCDVSLTYHKPNAALKCHYCSFEMPVIKKCPKCETEGLRFFGQGTQKVEEHLQERFPSARIMRMDVDTTSKKGSHQALISAFERREADILLGTQMVGKGLDFPHVTLVGVIAADLSLHISDFRAAERTFQLLTQVAGRAGRHGNRGEVLIQTFSPDHYALQCVVNHDYYSFYEKEMQVRRQFGYPPYYYLSTVYLSSEDYNALIMACDRVNQYLRQSLSKACVIVGPTMPHVGRVNQKFRMYFMIKYKIEPNIKHILTQLMTYFQEGSVNVFVDYYPNHFS